MSLEQLVQTKRDEILTISAKYGAHNVRIFGSVARGESRPDSDVDFLVDMEDGRSLLDLSGLWLDLEELLAHKVHVTEPDGLHWYIRDRILNEAIQL